jgi:predicted tellurium resistance membrane protein TerC
MPTLAKNGRRGLSAAVLVVGGALVAAAVWIGGGPRAAAIVFGAYLVFGLIAFIWSGGSGDVAAIMRGGSDERQHQIDLRATAAAGSATALFTVAAAIVSIARTGGNPGPYGVICLVFGLSYGVALVIFRRRI